ncbi:MAG: Ferrous-iron efflux pump FieF [Anaerolineae bacterium]|nr:Ferrous-iron efflux pump FieF [Anaerolineae bacterium]
MENRGSLTRYAWLSIAAALVTIGLKVGAYLITGSVGLLSDAAESIVNLVGAVVALAMLSIAARPPDDEHAYGHDKAEYFSSGVEGTLIFLAAILIAWAAIPRLFNPQPLEAVGVGLVVAAIASVVNFGVSRALMRAGKKYDSITLEADAQHLMTDVWTSVGVIAGVGAVALTGWNILDPLIALAVAANIVWTGYQLMRRSALGLMDTALPPQELKQVKLILEKYKTQGVEFHALRSRQAGARRFVSMHVLVPGDWTVQQGHQLLEQIEAEMRAALPTSTVFTHLEALNDPASYADTKLDRAPQEGK